MAFRHFDEKCRIDAGVDSKKLAESSSWALAAGALPKLSAGEFASLKAALCEACPKDGSCAIMLSKCGRMSRRKGCFMESLFCCPVCGGALTRRKGRYLCAAGHSFDIAREGYVNLLPANQQHSKAPGDDREMAAARTRFLEGGWYGPLREKLCRLIEELASDRPALLDAGCGEGWYTQAMAETACAKGGRTAGVDLSKPAVKKAARRCAAGEFAVGTLYHLPAADETVDLLVNCFSPLAAEEFARVVKPEGKFLYVVPGPRHLWELKEAVYERPYENEERREEYPGFRYLDVVPVECRFTLPDTRTIQDLFRMTPYYWKSPKAGAARLAELERLTVTGQFRIHVMERTGK